jgi:hypothetical protein
MRPAADAARLCSRRFPTSVVGPWPLESRGGMTKLTLCAEPAAVNVVFRVTPAAQHRRLDDVLRFQMALGATDLRMGSRQRKPGSRRMVEIPQFPPVRRVARGAGPGQGAVMDVISRVTAVAVRGGLLEVLCHVAQAAGRCNVQAEKRVGRQVVVEGDIAPPRDDMAFLAGLLHGGAVRVVGAVAANAVCAKLLNLHGCRVTGVAVDFCVRSGEWEFRVVVAGHPPNVVAVTISARDAEAALMAVVSLVTTDAALRNGGMKVTAAVTIGAPDMGMTPKKGETSLAGVIELLRIPVRGGMAAATLIPLVTFVNVIRCVAPETLRGCVPVFFARVTCRAGCLHMFARQCKGRLVMVEVRALPGFCVVTGSAVRS